MDKDVWSEIRNAIRSAERCVPRVSRKPQFSDRLIVQMYFMSVAWDRPRCFACCREQLPSYFRPRRLPSYSQFCRRLKAPRVIKMVAHVAQRLGESEEPIELAYIDGKELPISRQTTDDDAAVGHGTQGWYTGYRLHAIVGEDWKFKGFVLRPANESEARIAREQLTQYVEGGWTVLADAAYDSRYLYDSIGELEASFFAPIKKNKATTRSRTSAARLEAIRFWEEHPEQAAELYARRTEIERTFSQCCCCGGGLGPLPAWVRRLDRVTLWVTAKIAIHNARVTIKARRAA